MKPIDALIIAQSKIPSERSVTFGKFNLLPGNGSFVVTDSSAEVLEFMKEAGYDIKDIKMEGDIDWDED